MLKKNIIKKTSPPEIIFTNDEYDFLRSLVTIFTHDEHDFRKSLITIFTNDEDDFLRSLVTNLHALCFDIYAILTYEH